MSDKGTADKYLILTERFFPEEFLVNDLAAEIKESGTDIEVLAQVPSYPFDRVFDNYSNRLLQTTEEFHNIKVHRVKTYCGYNRSVVRKIFNYLNFALLTSLWCLFNGHRFKRVFIYHTGPLTMASAATVMRFFWRRECVIWTQDVWPDSVYAYGFKPTWWKRLLLDSFIRMIYSACDRITVSSPGFAEKLAPYTSKKVEFLPQWNQIKFDRQPCQKGEDSRKRVFTFAGNLGTAQNLEMLIEAFGELHLQHCVLQIVGSGIMLEPLKEQVRMKGYENIVFTGRLPQSRMPEIFANSDVMIISLKKEFSMTVPAKFQAYIAAGKPIMGVICNDTAALIRKYDLGIAVDPELEGIKETFRAFSECSDADLMRWQENSGKLSETEFNREKLIGRIKSMLTDDQMPSESVRMRTFCMLGGILLLGAVLTFLQRFMEPEMGRDSSLYLLLIEQWHTGGFKQILETWPTFWVPPLFLYGATLLTHCGLSPESAALTISMGCGILMPFVSFFIARELCSDRRIALAAALLTAVNPSIIDMAVQVQRDVPYLFVVGWTIYLLIAAIRRNNWYWWCGAGATFAVAFLIRYETSEFLPLLGIYFVVTLLFRRTQWKAALRNCLLFCFCALIGTAVLLGISGTGSSIAQGVKERIVEHFGLPASEEVKK